jgi:NAD(P)-dependent dehydrogenase (short-subunit alcohol dehydrogenase family)
MYQAAKFGLGGFSEALAKEIAPLGIYVTSVEPGGFRTNLRQRIHELVRYIKISVI